MLMGLIILAQLTDVRIAEDPADAARRTRRPATSRRRWSRRSRHAVFDGFPLGFFFVTVVTALILVLAANTAFNGFPVLGSILAQDRYLPRQLHTRGDRLAFCNGIVVPRRRSRSSW